MDNFKNRFFLNIIIVEYTAQDGLDVIRYLGISNLTRVEKIVFRKKWKSVYGGDFVGAIWTLYSKILPFTCGDDDRKSFAVSQLRDRDFGERVNNSGLEDDLQRGIPLQDILKKGSHVFIKTVEI